MSTSDQQGPLTRKQLREIRLTGSTPVISSEEAAAAAEAAPPAPPAPPLPRPAEPAVIPPAPTPADDAEHRDAPLTRRRARELEKVRTASVPVIGAEEADESSEAAQEADSTDEASTDREEPVGSAPVEVDDRASEIVSGIPAFGSDSEDDDSDLGEEAAGEPVRASSVADTVGEVPLESSEEPAAEARPDETEAALGLTDEPDATAAGDDVLADVDDADEEEIAAGARPTVNSSFGEGVLSDAPEPQKPFRPSFDELLSVSDSTGSQHSAPNALIFTPSPGEGSLSGPVASTGEILITGSYELPQGMGSQGHALGTTDGKEVDSVLIDGELPPASSPTPIAASSAVSTIKPAGEVIRPPAPEKGNRLMVTLAIVAGGLALAIGVVLVIAFTTKLI
ncbi:hypothetical protein [Microbacterium algeriense]|uniref:Uncharacterized protein n=1 Tax=Microbacterium algeriense TaxID=2615184 RepID=A0ABQ6V6U5_9MICO|nr:hypothetical protein [Microbacterium algeriense]KAB1864921.1 hypothetical protein F6A08_12735 [Microbacterium algeriense]